ncbi:LPS export ABC transporter periplasmic protein LptC [Cyanobacteria bacterium FACHB-471]|nr:LPS export ABC transporter periplasmic protein LptC [Cyanobacteria bacterium FACHB-471]
MRLKPLPLSRSVAWSLVVLMLLVTLPGCRRGNRASEQLAEDSSAVQNLESNLTFNNITLNQADDQGQTLWKIEADQATYSQDQQVARVENPEGELFQDGKAVFQIRAQSGEVQQDGEKVVLNGQIVATDLRDGMVLRGNQLEWRPEEDLLVVRNNLSATHPQLRVSATEARAYSRDRRVELLGKVVATSRDPALRLNAEHLTWRPQDQRIVSDRRIQVERLNGNRVTDRANADRAEVNLKTKVATLRQRANLALQDPPVVVTSNLLVWNLQNETLVSTQPVTVQQRQQQITLTADQGRMDINRKIVYLNRNVTAVSQRNQSELDSDSLTWNMNNQQVVAEGNVTYNQSNPPLNLRGPRAVGRLQDRTVVVSGGRVVTEIIPGSIN